MSLNSSSSSNASLHPPPPFSSLTFYELLYNCCSSTAGAFSMMAFSIFSIITILPLCVLVLYLGYQRWWQQRSGPTTSPSDLFTYHMVLIELALIFGSTLISCGAHARRPEVVKLGMCLCHINFCGQILFHVLTCLERYLAVVHPITYLGLRKASGIRVRNISIGCVWLLCFGGTPYVFLEDHVFANSTSFCFVGLAGIFILFCSISVLCVLIRPRPGEGGGDRPQVDQSKLRAFYTIMAILGVLLLKLGLAIFVTSLYDLPHLGHADQCGLLLSQLWFALPSSLVLPLLFLHKAGKLRCRESNDTSGQGSD